MIRDGTPADARRLAEIHIGSWQAAYAGLLPSDFLAGLSREVEVRTERWEQALSGNASDRMVLVAESADGNVVGFIHAGPSRDEDLGQTAGELYSMYLDPAAFRTGYGTRLHAELVARMRQAGFPQLALWVMAGNRGGRTFYERMGWKYDGTEADQCLGLTVPAVRYRLSL